jgi:hypothetical protein
MLIVNAVDAYLYGAGSLRSALSFQTADDVPTTEHKKSGKFKSPIIKKPFG